MSFVPSKDKEAPASRLWAHPSPEYLKEIAERNSDDIRKFYMQEWPVDRDRGTGRTTEQLMALPLGSLFVILNSSNVRYIKNLLMRLGRPDVQVTVYAEVIDEGFFRRRPVWVDVDHAVWEHLVDRSMHSYNRLKRHLSEYLSYIRKDDHGKGQTPRPHRT